MDDYRLRKILKKKVGIHLESDKRYLIENRLSDFMKKNNLSSFNQIADIIESGEDQDKIDFIIDSITTNETRFFRDEHVFSALYKYIETEIDKNSPMFIQILCLGCSSGQEPYSIAMGILEHFPNIFPRIKIQAFDINKTELSKAKKGEYTDFEIGRGVSDYYLNKYFEKTRHGHKIKKEIKSCITFKHHNLVELSHIGTFQFIFFRNVLIYFDEAMRTKLFDQIYKLLADKGILILGAAETPISHLSEFELLEYDKARFYRKNSKKILE